MVLLALPFTRGLEKSSGKRDPTVQFSHSSEEMETDFKHYQTPQGAQLLSLVCGPSGSEKSTPFLGLVAHPELQAHGHSLGLSELAIQFRKLHGYEDLRSTVWHFRFKTRICLGAI